VVEFGVARVRLVLVVAMDTVVNVVVGVVSVAVVFRVLPIFVRVAALCVVNER
jgi:hypothetical protein